MHSVAEESMRSYRNWRWVAREVGLELDLSHARLDADALDALSDPLRAALQSMSSLERGNLANSDEGRAVGHYWLRAPELAPTSDEAQAIAGAVHDIHRFARGVHAGSPHGATGRFKHLIHIGVGGSALGAQLLSRAASSAEDELTVHFLDNADPDGVHDLLARLDGSLGRTLVAVVSKSGITPTPVLVAGAVEDAFGRRDVSFGSQAIAITMRDTPLDRMAIAERWLARFPLWEWVGGRTSVTSAVGLLPAALQGMEIDQFLAGAAAMDESTRAPDPRRNPGAMLAATWHLLGGGRGRRAMVVLPYRDSLDLLPRYVQQLVMESLGKRLDRSGNQVNQGLTVYGHKGVTDQHAYVQQLREGPDDFFVLFVGVRQDSGPPLSIDEDVTLGDHLYASLEGMREALRSDGRRSISIELDDLSPRSVGAVVALFERAVGLYAELIDVNAYHQPSVDKNLAIPVLELQSAMLAHLRGLDHPETAAEIAAEIGHPGQAPAVFRMLTRLTRLPGRGVDRLGPDDPERAAFAVARVPPG